MANVRNLKKDVNYVLGDIIEAAYIWQYTNTDKDTKQSDAVVDEAIETFDALIVKINDKSVTNKKAHFKALNAELEEKGRALIEKINNLK